MSGWSRYSKRLVDVECGSCGETFVAAIVTEYGTSELIPDGCPSCHDETDLRVQGDAEPPEREPVEW